MRKRQIICSINVLIMSKLTDLKFNESHLNLQLNATNFTSINVLVIPMFQKRNIKSNTMA